MDLIAAQQFLRDRQEPAYRGQQLKRAYVCDFVSGWEALTVFPKALRQACAERFAWSPFTVWQTQASQKGDTVKALFQCQDGQKIETVLMRHGDRRNTVCVSSQIGCAMACRFCATGTMGLKRNLTAEEIAAQVIYFAGWLKDKGEKVTNVVMMGMGEPFHNYDAVLESLHTLNDQEGFCLGARHISISTCGIVSGILRLADEPLQVNLAISLHSAVSETRSKLMPVNRAYPLPKLMAAVRAYMAKTNRQVMFEYVLLRGVNDRPEDAKALAQLFEGDTRLVHVNLIKYHQTATFQATERNQRLTFLEQLHRYGIPATHRVTFGEDIDAACGQLALKGDRSVAPVGV